MPEVLLVTIECHTRLQIPSFQVLGLAATEIQEAKERILSAFQAGGLEFPKRRVILNLAPSGIPKYGTGYDLAMALSVLQCNFSFANNTFAWGELSLDGSVHSCGKMAFWLEKLCEFSEANIYCAQDDAQELNKLIYWRISNSLSVPKKLKIFPLNNLIDFNTAKVLGPFINKIFEKNLTTLDLPPLRPGLERWIKLALIGGHHGLLLGPRGVGKSTALRWIETLAPPRDFLSDWERIRYSGLSQDFSVTRRVHSSVRAAHLIGGTTRGQLRPGELTLAHGGILIADEFPEWSRDAKECLREPLEEGKFTLVRKEGSFKLPSKVQWIGTGNLCPCGGMPNEYSAFQNKELRSTCICSPGESTKYLRKISGPILDRIDLVTMVQPSSDTGRIVDANKIKEEILLKREQRKKAPTIRTIGLLPTIASYRSRNKVVEIAKTIAVLNNRDMPEESDYQEALSYRPEAWLFTS